MALNRNPPLEDRVRQLRAELDAAIDAYAKEVAKTCTGIPLGVVRQTIVGNEQCDCAAYQSLLDRKLI